MARWRPLLAVLAIVLGVGVAQRAWQRHLEGDTGERLAALARPGDVHMVSSITCVFCTQARQWLQAHGVAHTECFIERDEACAAQYRALMGPGTPLLLVKGQAQLGFSPQRVLARLSLPA